MIGTKLDDGLAFLRDYLASERLETINGDAIDVDVKITYDHESSMFTASIVHAYLDFTASEQFAWSAPTLAAALVGLVREIKEEKR